MCTDIRHLLHIFNLWSLLRPLVIWFPIILSMTVCRLWFFLSARVMKIDSETLLYMNRQNYIFFFSNFPFFILFILFKNFHTLPHPLFCPRLYVLNIHSPCFNQDTVNENFCRKKIYLLMVILRLNVNEKYRYILTNGNMNYK